MSKSVKVYTFEGGCGHTAIALSFEDCVPQGSTLFNKENQDYCREHFIKKYQAWAKDELNKGKTVLFGCDASIIGRLEFSVSLSDSKTSISDFTELKGFVLGVIAANPWETEGVTEFTVGKQPPEYENRLKLPHAITQADLEGLAGPAPSQSILPDASAI